MIGLDFDILAALAAVSFTAGFVDAIAGGGGLISLPALMLAGLDPAHAIATNKVGGSFASGSATFAFARRRLIDWSSAWRYAAIAFISGALGALSVRFLPRAILEIGIPPLLIGIAVFFALSRRISDKDALARVSAIVFGATVPVLIGFYDGIFGPGAGSFYMLALVLLLGHGVLRATAHTKLLNLASNLGSLLLFATTGLVIWPVGLVMAGASLIGAQLGARLAVRFGVVIIRPLLVVVSCAMALRLLTDPGNPFRQFWAHAF